MRNELPTPSLLGCPFATLILYILSTFLLFSVITHRVLVRLPLELIEVKREYTFLFVSLVTTPTTYKGYFNTFLYHSGTGD